MRDMPGCIYEVIYGRPGFARYNHPEKKTVLRPNRKNGNDLLPPLFASRQICSDHTIVRSYQRICRAICASLEACPCFRGIMAAGWLPCGAFMTLAGRLRDLANAMPEAAKPPKATQSHRKAI